MSKDPNKHKGGKKSANRNDEIVVRSQTQAPVLRFTKEGRTMPSNVLNPPPLERYAPRPRTGLPDNQSPAGYWVPRPDGTYYFVAADQVSGHAQQQRQSGPSFQAPAQQPGYAPVAGGQSPGSHPGYGTRPNQPGRQQQSRSVAERRQQRQRSGGEQTGHKARNIVIGATIGTVLIATGLGVSGIPQELYANHQAKTRYDDLVAALPPPTYSTAELPAADGSEKVTQLARYAIQPVFGEDDAAKKIYVSVNIQFDTVGSPSKVDKVFGQGFDPSTISPGQYAAFLSSKKVNQQAACQQDTTRIVTALKAADVDGDISKYAGINTANLAASRSPYEAVTPENKDSFVTEVIYDNPKVEASGTTVASRAVMACIAAS